MCAQNCTKCAQNFENILNSNFQRGVAKPKYFGATLREKELCTKFLILRTKLHKIMRLLFLNLNFVYGTAGEMDLSIWEAKGGPYSKTEFRLVFFIKF